MPAGLLSELAARERFGPKARRWIVCAAGVRSGGGLHGYLEPERFELARESTCAMLDRVAAGEPVGAELAEGDAVADDVVVGDEDVVSGGAGRLGLAAAAADLGVVRGEVGAFAARGGLGRLGERLA